MQIGHLVALRTFGFPLAAIAAGQLHLDRRGVLHTSPACAGPEGLPLEAGVANAAQRAASTGLLFDSTPARRCEGCMSGQGDTAFFDLRVASSSLGRAEERLAAVRGHLAAGEYAQAAHWLLEAEVALECYLDEHLAWLTPEHAQHGDALRTAGEAGRRAVEDARARYAALWWEFEADYGPYRPQPKPPLYVLLAKDARTADVTKVAAAVTPLAGAAGAPWRVGVVPDTRRPLSWWATARLDHDVVILGDATEPLPAPAWALFEQLYEPARGAAHARDVFAAVRTATT